MHLSSSVIQGAYFRDLMAQPQAIQQTLQALRGQSEFSQSLKRVTRRDLRSVILTGMGSSLYALHPLNLRLIEFGYNCWMIETSELIHYQKNLLNPETLIIVVSQSGSSAEIVRLLEMADEETSLIGITNTADSPLATKARAALLTAAGEEFTVSCKTYLATLMALEWVGSLLTGQGTERIAEVLEGVMDPLQKYLSAWTHHVDQLSELLRDIKILFLVGRGSSLAAVGTGGLILKESTRQQAEGMSCASFRHGPMEMLNQDVFVQIFAGAAKTRQLNENLLNEVKTMGARAALAGEEQPTGVFCLPKVAEELRPLMEILPVEMITLARAALLGRESGRFERASKVTLTE
jgi:glucosamine--fructose-6-phosphate aminotransferase (isomerizing)